MIEYPLSASYKISWNKFMVTRLYWPSISGVIVRFLVRLGTTVLVLPMHEKGVLKVKNIGWLFK